MKNNYYYAVFMTLLFVCQTQAMDIRADEKQAGEAQKQGQPDRSSSQTPHALLQEDRPANGVSHDAGDVTIDPQRAAKLKKQLDERARKREREKSISETARESFGELRAMLTSLSETPKGTSSFRFSDNQAKDDQAKEAYFKKLLDTLENSFKDDKSISTNELESVILEHAKSDLIIFDEKDFSAPTEDGHRVIDPYTNSLLKALRQAAQGAPEIKAKMQSLQESMACIGIAQEARECETRDAFAVKTRASWEPLEDLVLHHNQGRIQEHQNSKSGWGWKGHLLTATVASAVTLGAVYAGLRLSNHKLVSATA